MKITRIDVTPVRMPKRRPSRSALGTHDIRDFGIVQVRTDEGIAGLGEISTIWDSGAVPLCREVEEYLAPSLIGRDPFHLSEIIRLMDSRWRWSKHAACAKAAVEMALYDIMGKALNTPVYNLLGGPVRDKVVLSMSIFMDSVEKRVQQAMEYVRQGFMTVKVKVGVDIEDDVAAVKAIRDAVGPKVNIRIDVNMGWTNLKQAVAAIRRLEALDVHSIEQPLPPGRLADLAALRTMVDVPIMVDEDLWEPQNAIDLIKAEAADIFNVYVSEAGGISAARDILAMGERVGILGAIGSMPELGIGTSAQLHLAVAAGNLPVPSDVCGFLYSEDDLILERLRVEDGFAFAPDGPGLGVTLDEEALEKYAIEARR